MTDAVTQLTISSPVLGAICVIVLSFLSVLIWVVRSFLRKQSQSESAFLASLTRIHGECEEGHALQHAEAQVVQKETTAVVKENAKAWSRVEPIMERAERLWLPSQKPAAG